MCLLHRGTWLLCQLMDPVSGGSMVKNLPASAGDAVDVGSIPGWERSPGGGNGNPTPVFLPGKNPEDRGAWWATVHGTTQSQT